MSEKRKGHNGNTIAEQHALDKRLHRNGFVVETAERIFDRYWDEGCEITKVTIRPPADADGEWLVVVAGTADGNKVVAFHRGMSFGEALIGMLNRLDNRSVKWNPDKYG